MRVLAKAPPHKQCVASLMSGKVSFEALMIDRAPKGSYEISGTVAEVLRVLASADPNAECIASVTFKGDGPVTMKPLPDLGDE